MNDDDADLGSGSGFHDNVKVNKHS